jgi:hypothetical protein
VIREFDSDFPARCDARDLFGFGGIDGQRIMAIFVLTKAANLKSTLVSGGKPVYLRYPTLFEGPKGTGTGELAMSLRSVLFLVGSILGGSSPSTIYSTRKLKGKT